MDPKQCLLNILNAIDGCCGPDAEAVTQSREDAIESLRDLADWLERGGFAPSLPEVLESLR
jgi:hypothetical protein